MDGIHAEMKKAGGKKVIYCLKKIVNEVWLTGDWPDIWKQSELITLPKVPRTQDCASIAL